MSQVIIENPILNSTFKEPTRCFRFSDEGITDEIVEARRVSSYFMPIAKPKKKGKSSQPAFDTEWTQDRVKENALIYRVATVTIIRNINAGKSRSVGIVKVLSSEKEVTTNDLFRGDDQGGTWQNERVYGSTF